jgi:hypothetical protein
MRSKQNEHPVTLLPTVFEDTSIKGDGNSIFVLLEPKDNVNSRIQEAKITAAEITWPLVFFTDTMIQACRDKSRPC